MNSTVPRSSVPWLILVSRLAVFLIIQALIAVILWLGGVSDAWRESARWWVFTAIAGNLVSILLLVWAFRREDERYVNLLRIERKAFWRHFALAVAALILAAPIASVPTALLARMLFGSADAPVEMMFRPLPLWAIVVGLLFPLTIAFAELPTYFGYAMPRLERQLGKGWLAWLIASFFLSIQHAALPLILDWRFIVWRAFMYLPFALYVGLVLKVRPRLLPYLMVGHFLIDLLALSVYFSF